MAQTKVVSVVLCVDADGDYGTGKDVDEARSDYEAQIANLCETEGFRLIQVDVVVPLSEMVTLSGTATGLGVPELKSVTDIVPAAK